MKGELGRRCFTPIGTAMIEIKKKETGFGKNAEKLEPLCVAGENVKCCSCCGKQFGGSHVN